MDQYHYTRLALDEEQLYARVLADAAMRLGFGRRTVRVADLARRTAWLVGCRECSPDGRGTDARALAAAALYWCWLLDHLRGFQEPPSPRRAWELVGSSRPSFYRAMAVWARYVVGLENHHPLLRYEGAYVARCRCSTGSCSCSRPGAVVVGVEPGGYTVLCRASSSCRPGLGEVELLVLPVHGDGWRRGMRGGYVSATVTFDVVRLMLRLRSRFGSTVTAHDVASELSITPQSAGRLLSRLEQLGLVEKLGNGRWRLRELPGDTVDGRS